MLPLANLQANTDVLWAHITLSFVLFPVAILVMRRFSVDVNFQEVGLEMRKTLMVERVPKYMCKEQELKRHFHEAYAESVQVQNVRFAYDVAKLQQIHGELKDAKIALKYCQRQNHLGKEQFHVYRHNCSRFCSCFCCCCSDKTEGKKIGIWFFRYLIWSNSVLVTKN